MMALRRIAVSWSTSMQLRLFANSQSLSRSVLSSSSNPKSMPASYLSSLSLLSSKRRHASILSIDRPFMFEDLRCQYVIHKIIDESKIANFSDDIETFTNTGDFESYDYDTLKSLLKDLRKYNRKNNNYPKTTVASTQNNNYSKTTVASTKNKMNCRIHGLFHRPLYLCHRNKELDIDAPSICRMAQLVVKKYNKEKKSKLELVSVLRAYMGISPIETHILVHACDPVVARVSIKLRAFCIRERKKGYVVEEVQICKPVPFMTCKDETDKPNLSRSYTETLLFANIRGCAIINKRLGLKRLCELHCEKSLPHVVKVSLEDDTLLSLAEFAVDQQKEEQTARLICLGIIGAWRELVENERVLHHIMLKVLEGKVKKKFYAVVATESSNEDAKLLDWVAADSFKARAIMT